MIKPILMRLSKIIWFIGFVIFMFLSFDHQWGGIKFVFSWLSSLVSENSPSPLSIQHAKSAFSVLFPITVMCMICQLIVFATSPISTGSSRLVAYYTKREADYIQSVCNRVELSKQIADANKHLETLHSEIQQCRALLSHLGRDTKTLTDSVALSRKTLTDQINHTSNLNNKGNF